MARFNPASGRVYGSVPAHSGAPASHSRLDRRPSRRSASRRRTRLRVVYFGLASFWGFVAGSGALLVALRATGARFRLDGRVTVLLVASTVITLLGGLLAAKAYHDACKRV